MNNKKGFTLIELIAVIVILGVLMLLAIPAVSRYIEEANKKSYLATIDSIVDTVRYGVNSGDSNYSMDGVNEKKFKLKDIETEKGKNTNIYGYVKVVKKSTGEYEYKVFSSGSSNSSSYCINEIDYNNLSINNLNKCIGADYDYEIGDTITYKGSTWYVMKNSPSTDNYVTLMKDKVLTSAELGTYRYVGYGTYDAAVFDKTSPYSNDYATSNVKEALESYMSDKGMTNDLKEVDGYKIRLITFDELMDDFSFEEFDPCNCGGRSWRSSTSTPSWVYSGFEGKSATVYWTMTPVANHANNVWTVHSGSGGTLNYYNVTDITYNFFGVRPIINLLKSNIPTQN